MSPSSIEPAAAGDPAVAAILLQDRDQTVRDTNRLIAWLLVAQLLTCIALALWVTPFTWIGGEKSLHVHLLVSMLLAPLLAFVPLIFLRALPVAPITPHVFAVAQVMFSALLIHLTGGRIETHFHVFGSLAILTFYRDQRVLFTAAAVVALDHALRGIFAPASVFGVLSASEWRWMEHAGWVVFEVFFLRLSIRRENRTSIERAHLLHRHEARGNLAERSMEQLKGALDAACIVAVTDRKGTITFANDLFCKISGYSREELLGQNHRILNSGYHPKSFFTEMFSEISTGGIWRGTIRNRAKNGSFYWVDTTIVPFKGEDGTVEQYVSLRADVTERMVAEVARMQSEERYALAVRGSRDGLWDWDLVTDQIFYAPRWCEMLGAVPGSLSDSPHEWFTRIASADLARFHEELTRHLEGKNDHFDMEVEMMHADGGHRWMLCRAAALRDEHGRAVRLSGSLADITELHEAKKKLLHLATHDRLTGLANRQCFTERLVTALGRSKRNQAYHFAVLFFDIDRFKLINDSMGHRTGDALLIGVASRLKACLRNGDVAARFGGDEFVVLLEGIADVEEAKNASVRFLAAISKPYELNGLEVVITASIGVVTDSQRYELAEEMVRDADVAMYQAKSEGKARYCLFDSKMHEEAIRQLTLEQDLRRAVFAEEMHLLYQPIIALDTNEVVGFEALVRWNHPTQGLIRPDHFIPIAEETGLIVQLGEWVLREACRQIRVWRTQFGQHRRLTVNVNVSRRQMIQPDFIDVLRRAIGDYQINPADLKLEITETAIMDERDDMITALNRVHDMGLKLAMDDFGTGHSSLSCLHRFPIDVLKIDRSFVNNLTERREFVAVMHAIISLAQHLKLEVVAEGIETTDQLVQLQTMECGYGQGYLFAKPLTVSAATMLMSESLPRAKSA